MGRRKKASGLAGAQPPVESANNKPHATKKQMEAKGKEVKAAWGKSNEAALKVGKILMEFEDSISKVSFKKFVEEQVDFSAGQAYRLIRAYRAFYDVGCDILSHFDLSALYKLASRGEGYDQAKAEALERAAAGEYISDKIAKAIIKQHVEPKPAKTRTHTIPVAQEELVKACKARKVDMEKLLAVLQDLHITLKTVKDDQEEAA